MLGKPDVDGVWIGVWKRVEKETKWLGNTMGRAKAAIWVACFKLWFGSRNHRVYGGT
jgi:hypothetical protein